MTRASASAVVFLGPSLSRTEAEALAPDVEFRPPAQAGDIYRACRQGRAETIGLVDGVIGTAPSVSHKEILYALSRGIRVLGSSAVGALRSAECSAFGMEGVGEVFEMYATGVLEADDEVAVHHLDELDGFAPTTVPMVRVRKIIDTALGRGLLEPDEAATLIAACIEVFYADRTSRLVEATISGHVPSDRASRIIETAWTDETDPQGADARTLLNALAAPRPEGGDSRTTPGNDFVFEPTVFWQRLRAEVDFPALTPWFDDPKHPVDLARRIDIARGALLEPYDSPLGRDRRLFALLVQAECSRLGIDVASAGVGRKAEAFRRTHDLLDVKSMRTWLRDNGLSIDEWYAALAFGVQLDELAAERASELRSQIPLLAAVHGGWESLRALEGGTRAATYDVSDDELRAELVARALNAAEDRNLDEIAADLGFVSASELRVTVAGRPRRSTDGTDDDPGATPVRPPS